MSDEIKEIMDEILWQFEKHPIDGDYLLEEKSAKAIYDYITNLQEENERLKEENKHIFSKVNDDELLISNAMNYAEAQDYKSRCEKAIEYINNLEKDYDINVWQEDKHWAYVLYILTVGDKE